MANIVDVEVDRTFYGWTLVGESELDTRLVLVKPAEVGRVHVVERIEAGYSDILMSGLLTVKFDEVLIGKKPIHGVGTLDYPGYGRRSPHVNEALIVVLTAGSEGVRGILTVVGYTTGI